MLPYAGLRVLDLSRVLAGPYCCALLADLGADVVKVERPGTGDENRQWGHLWHGTSLDFLNVNRNKRGITVDLAQPDGQGIIRKLVETADVLVENFVPGTLERYGLSYVDLAPLNPRLVYCSISAYGDKGPLSGKPGYDGALQAFSGHMMITGEAESGPVRSGASVIDMTSGLVAYGAVATALLGREKSGRGQRITVSLFHTALALMGTHGAVCLNTGRQPTRAGAGVSHLAPYGAYKTQDSWLVIGALSEHAWHNLCEALSLTELAADSRFSGMQERLKNRNELDALIGNRLAERDTSYWMGILETAGLVCSPVRTLAEALADPQTSENRMLMKIDSLQGELKLVRGPASYADWLDVHTDPPPDLSQHTDTILLEAGFQDVAIEGLRQAGVI
jgi:crotonobetainyl-CoA:carnitine CoA-transferase CaiB-like acyl-CoA transferase